MSPNDPFRHHPELRGRIKPADQSYFRDMNLEEIDERAAANGRPADWRTPCDVREEERREWLKNIKGEDLWVFGYGSLMWDPALIFAEVRHARTNAYQRSFCLWDDGARGSPHAPGLMLALDTGASCEGLAFRIEADRVDHETFILFRREMIARAYLPRWMQLDSPQGPIKALGFVANHDIERIKPGIPLHEQAQMIAIAEGHLGTNFEYLSETHARLELMDIEDDYIKTLFAAVSDLRRSAT